jgi:hypothetical protein
MLKQILLGRCDGHGKVACVDDSVTKVGFGNENIELLDCL